MARSFGGVGTALAALGVTLSAGMFVKFASDGIKAMAMLHDLADVSGITVESLSSMTEVAKLSGTDLETVAGSAGKLSKAMLEFASTGKGKAAQAFTDLGVAVTDSFGKLRDSDQVMQEVAKKLFGMESATQRVAYAQLLFGKEGAKLLPFLRELAEAGTLSATATTAQAAAADKFEDNLVKLGTASTKLKIAFANDLLPSLIGITDEFLRAKKEGEGFLAMLSRGLSVAIFGTDRNRNNRELIAQTEKLWELQNQLDDMETKGVVGQAAAPRRAKLQAEITDQQKAIATTLALSKAHEEEDETARVAEKRRKDALNNIGITGSKGKVAPAEKDAIIALNKSLDDELVKKQNILRVTEVTKALEDERFKKSDPDLKKKAIAQAAALDMLAAEEMFIKRIAEEEQALIADGERLKKIDEERKKILDNMSQTATERMHAADTVDWSEAAKELNSKLEDGTKWAREMGLTFTSAFEDAVAGGKGFRVILEGIISDIGKIALRNLVTEPLGSAGTKFIKEIDWKNLFNFGGERAGGGPVMGGSSYLVGEHGPEMLLMGRGASGSIIPGGGGGVSVNNNFTIDARGAGPGVEVMIRNAVARAQRETVPQVVDAVRRGGSARSFMGR